MRRFLCLLLLSALVPLGDARAKPASVAATSSSIVAVVNDTAITGYDLSARIHFVLATAKISNSPESIERLKPQILRALIDEYLQIQEAERSGITITDKEIEQAISAIETQREMAPGAIAAMLASQHVPEESFTHQIRAQILWQKLLQRKLRSQIQITDEEVAQMTRKLSAPVVKKEMRIALLQLPVDRPERDKEVRQAAEKMVLEVRSGANFEELARQFSGGAAAAAGKLATFWVRPEELDPYIAKSLAGAQEGSVTEPLKNELGYALIKVYELRDLPDQAVRGTEISLKEITLRLRSSADEKEMEALKKFAEIVAQHPGSCDSKSLGDVGDMSAATIEVKPLVSLLADLPPALRVIAEGMKEGEISGALASDEGVKLYMMCGKREGVAAVVDSERARAAVYQQRMELEAQKYMRNLRRDAFIEIRQ